MLNRIVSIATLLITLSIAATGCMDEPIDFGAYPEADDPGLVAEVSKDEAAAIGEAALLALNEGDYADWTDRWQGSLRDAIGRDAFLEFRGALLERWGRFVELHETRITAASEPGYVRFSFLAEFEAGYLTMVHVYPIDGTEIAGVHLRDAVTGELPL